MGKNVGSWAERQSLNLGAWLACSSGGVWRAQGADGGVHPLCMGPTCLCGGPPVSPLAAAGPCRPPHPASPKPHKAPPSGCLTWDIGPSSSLGYTPTPSLQPQSLSPWPSCHSFFFVSCLLSSADHVQRHERTPFGPGAFWRILVLVAPLVHLGVSQTPFLLASTALAPT